MHTTKTRSKRNKSSYNNVSKSANGKYRSGGPSRRKNGGGRSAGGRGRKPASTIDPETLVRKATVTESVEFVSDKRYEDMPLHGLLKRNLERKGYERPTQIQEETLEHLLGGRNLIGVAQTGTGKTGSFLIPIVQQLLKSKKPFQSLVVVPTRELALQVEEEFKTLAHKMRFYSACFIGGTSIGRDLHELRRSHHVIIATPGRLIDLMNRRALDISTFSTLVLDEFDRMLDMGFIRDVQKIIDEMPNRRQTILFSATVDKSQEKLIASIVADPVEVRVSSGAATADLVDQDIIRVNGDDKFELLMNVITTDACDKVLIFEETKRRVDRLDKKLRSSGIKSALIHGDKSQNYRVKALDKFKSGKVQVLVATDVAARGIDVSDITHVINYQVPQTYESYLHRIGRTGRAGKTGKALTFVD